MEGNRMARGIGGNERQQGWQLQRRRNRAEQVEEDIKTQASDQRRRPHEEKEMGSWEVWGTHSEWPLAYGGEGRARPEAAPEGFDGRGADAGSRPDLG